MYIEPDTGKLHLGSSIIPLSERELAEYRKQRESQAVGEAGWPDEKVLAFVLWKSGNVGLGSLIKFYDNIALKPEF